AAVDLDGGDGKACQVNQRGESGTKAVERERQAEAGQRPQGLNRLLGLGDNAGLVDFQRQEVRIEACLVQGSGHQLHQLRVLELALRQIDANLDRVFAHHLYGAALQATVQQDPSTDLGEQSGRLGNLEKRLGLQQAARRMLPAQQGLQR